MYLSFGRKKLQNALAFRSREHGTVVTDLRDSKTLVTKSTLMQLKLPIVPFLH